MTFPVTSFLTLVDLFRKVLGHRDCPASVGRFIPEHLQDVRAYFADGGAECHVFVWFDAPIRFRQSYAFADVDCTISGLVPPWGDRVWYINARVTGDLRWLQLLRQFAVDPRQALAHAGIHTSRREPGSTFERALRAGLLQAAAEKGGAAQ